MTDDGLIQDISLYVYGCDNVNSMTFKQSVHKAFLELINHKINGFESKLAELKESVQNETKSTAGDKHETARAHLQIEQEQTNQHLLAALQQKDVLDRLNPLLGSSVIGPGSIVTTQQRLFYISTGLGKLAVEGKTIISLSLQSPLGMKMKGLKVNDTVEMNGVRYTISNIA